MAISCRIKTACCFQLDSIICLSRLSICVLATLNVRCCKATFLRRAWICQKSYTTTKHPKSEKPTPSAGRRTCAPRPGDSCRWVASKEATSAFRSRPCPPAGHSSLPLAWRMCSARMTSCCRLEGAHSPHMERPRQMKRSL